MRPARLFALPGLLISIAALAAPAPTASSVAPTKAAQACVDSCGADQDRCAVSEVMDAGADRQNLCAARFKICIERCDPHYLNYRRAVDEHPVKSDGPAVPKMTAAEQCADGCGAQAQTCANAGNSAKVCGESRMACTRRCEGH